MNDVLYPNDELSPEHAHFSESFDRFQAKVMAAWRYTEFKAFVERQGVDVRRAFDGHRFVEKGDLRNQLGTTC